MEKVAIGTNDLGMHIVIRPISKDLLSKDEIVGMETGKINSLLTARRPITLVDAISALPPLLPSSADPITGRRLYSVNEIMSGSCGIHFGSPVPELLRYETELSVKRHSLFAELLSDCLQGLFEHRYLSELRGTVPSKWNRILE